MVLVSEPMKHRRKLLAVNVDLGRNLYKDVRWEGVLSSQGIWTKILQREKMFYPEQVSC